MKKHYVRNIMLGVAFAAAWVLHAEDAATAPRASLARYYSGTLEELKALFEEKDRLCAETDDPDERTRLIRESGILAFSIQRLGDRAALPFLEEKSLSANITSFTRSNLAYAYIMIANVDESVAFMRKWYFTMDGQGERGSPYRLLLGKVSADVGNVGKETLDSYCAFLLEVVQRGGSNDVDIAHKADVFLLAHLPGYADSKQRATLQRFANAGNENQTNTFNPIKAHFEAIPPSKRPDLRARFPNLPPSAGEEETPEKTGFPRVWLAVGTLLALAAAAAVLFKTKKSRAP